MKMNFIRWMEGGVSQFFGGRVLITPGSWVCVCVARGEEVVSCRLFI